MNYVTRMSSDVLEKRIDVAVGLPLHQFIDIRVVKINPGASEIELFASEKFVNTADMVHGGVIYSTLDTAAYLAILPLIEDSQICVTHDIHVSMLRACPIGKTIVFKGFLRKIGKRLAFCDSEAWCDSELVATARITKSII